MRARTLLVGAPSSTRHGHHPDGTGVRMLTSRPNNEGVSARDADPLFQTTQHHDFDAEHGAVKRQATAAAKLALAGFCLLSVDGGGFVVGRWNLSRQFPDILAVEQFQRSVAP